MYYVSRVVTSRNGITIYIMDTEDGVEERVSQTACKKLLAAGVEVKGLSQTYHGFVEAVPYTPPSADSARTALVQGYNYSAVDGGLRSLVCADKSRCKRIELGSLASKILSSSIDLDSFGDVTFIVDDRVKQFSSKACKGWRSYHNIVFQVTDCTNDKVLRNVYAMRTMNWDVISITDQTGRYTDYQREADVFYSVYNNFTYKFMDSVDEEWFLKRNKKTLLDLCEKSWLNCVPKLKGSAGLRDLKRVETTQSLLIQLKTGKRSPSFIEGLGGLVLTLGSIFSLKDKPLYGYIAMNGQDREICYRYARLLWLLSMYAYNADCLLSITSDYTWDDLRRENFFLFMNEHYKDYFTDAPYGQMGEFK